MYGDDTSKQNQSSTMSNHEKGESSEEVEYNESSHHTLKHDRRAEGEDESNKDKDLKKPRRELPAYTVAILKAWMLSPEHVKHPYPTDDDKNMLLEQTGINMKQLTNWFTNARKRIWKPMMRREHSRQLQYANNRNDDVDQVVGKKQDSRANSSVIPSESHISHLESLPSSHSEHDNRQYDSENIHNGPSSSTSTVSSENYNHHDKSGLMYPEPASRESRSISETNVQEIDDFIDAVRIRKRVGEKYSRQVRSSSDFCVPSSHPSSHHLQQLNNSKKRALDHDQQQQDGATTDPSKVKKTRRSALLPPRVIRILKDWMMSPAHVEHPYPTDIEKNQLCEATGLDLCQLNNWFANNRKRLWKPKMASRNNNNKAMDAVDSSYSTSSEHHHGKQTGDSRLYSNEAVRNVIYGNSHNDGASNGVVAARAPHDYHSVADENTMIPLSLHSCRDYGSNNYSPTFRDGLPTLNSVPPSTFSHHSFNINPSLPKIGMPKDGRSHTLDMGHFLNSKRSSMNIQDILEFSKYKPIGKDQVHHHWTSIPPQSKFETNVHSGNPTFHNGPMRNSDLNVVSMYHPSPTSLDPSSNDQVYQPTVLKNISPYSYQSSALPSLVRPEHNENTNPQSMSMKNLCS